MKKLTIITVLNLFITFSVLGQIPNAKEYSKAITLYKAKRFLVMEVFGASPEPKRFEAWPLAAATSGELTTLVYKCKSLGKEGLAFAFYGSNAYGFKNLPKEKAFELLDKTDKLVKENEN